MKTMRTIFYFLLIIAFFVSCKKEETVQDAVKSKQPAPVSLTTATQDTLADGSCFKIRLQQDSAAIDETCFIFKHSATTAYSASGDARYFPGMGIGSLSSFTGDGIECAIQTLPYSPRVAIRLNTGFRSSGIYMLKLSFLQSSAAIHIWLHDAMKRDSMDLRVGNYAFNVNTADTSSFGANRFKVVLN